MKTIITIEIDHREKLPDDLTDVLADRAYGFIHAKGSSCGDVTAKVEVSKPNSVPLVERRRG